MKQTTFLIAITFSIASCNGQPSKPSFDELLKSMDRNNDQKISKPEAQGPLVADFENLDRNKDGFLERSEIPKQNPTISSQQLNHKVKIYEKDGFRYIETNGIPNHKTGQFPSEFCPFAIGAKEMTYKIPLIPTIDNNNIPAGDYMFGIALNGVMFDPAGPFWNKDSKTGWEFHPAADTLKGFFGVDFNNAHTQPLGPFSSDGLYHYHALPTSLIDILQKANPEQKIILLGYAADGYPIYNDFGLVDPNNLQSGYRKMKSSYQLKEGTRKTGEPSGKYNGVFVQDYYYKNGSGDLDEYNGRFGKTPEYPNGTYYYCITNEFPNMPLKFKGIPDGSFKHEGPGNSMAEVPPAIRNWPKTN